MRMVRTPSFVLTVILLTANAASAQPDNLAGMLKRLFDQSTINAVIAPTDGAAPIDHRSHFIVGDALRQIPGQFNVALASQLASFPIGSSSGGFSFSVNERGEVVPTSTTFGPAFAERGLTLGKSKFNFGFSFQATSYDSFEGVDLESGGLRFIREHNDCCPATGPNAPSQVTDLNPAFERDLLQSDLSAKIDTKTTAFFASVGVTDRLDVGVAVPIVTVDLDATVNSRILRLGSGETSVAHSFPGGTSPTLSLSDSGSASGIGDILLRSKYNFYRSNSTALAAALELRLPTGNEDELLGTGATGTKIFFIGSGEYGRFSPHVNIGYTLSSGQASAEASSFDLDADYGAVPNSVTSDVDLSVPDEFNYTAGFNVAVVPRVTVGFDILGRYLRDVTRFDLESITYLNRGPGTLPTTSFTSQNEVAIASSPGNLNFMLGVVGGKFNFGKRFILNATVLFAMTDGGLKPKPTPVIGFDYVF